MIWHNLWAQSFLLVNIGSSTALGVSSTLNTVKSNDIAQGGDNDDLARLPRASLPSWGRRTVLTDPSNIPNTGVTRHYDLTVARCSLAPDGVQKDMICVNGQFPGPTLSADWGDYFDVRVHNNLTEPEDGTAIHWHGLFQHGTPHFDGVPGISQCPIAPGSSLRYIFRADTYGTSWYHSHYSMQYSDGLYGGLVIRGPTSQPFDVDLGPVLVSDWYHDNSRDLVKKAMSSNPLVSQTTFADGSLINGRMDFSCSITASTTTCSPRSGLSKFRFQPGKVHLLRFVNTGTFAHILVSIDQHTMTVIANDFVPITPYKATTITLSAGQRTDVLVTANPSSPTFSSGAFWLRTRQPTLCSLAYQPFALAAIYYDDASMNNNVLPLSLPQLDFVTPRLLNCSNDALEKTEPTWSITPPTNPDRTVTINITNAANGTGQQLYYMAGSSFYADYNAPALDLAQRGQGSFADGLNLYSFGTANSIRLIFNNGVPFSHPMHIHGQNFFVLAEGDGAWDGIIVRPRNPQRRDTQLLRPRGHLVVQLQSDNPGVWPLHCHFSPHVSQGLVINLLQRPDLLKQYKNITSFVKQSCDPWDDFTTDHIVDQIDSGLKFLAAMKRQWQGRGFSGMWHLVKRLFAAK